MNRHKFQVVLATILLVTSCARQPVVTAREPPGFLLGFAHGFLVVFSLIGSFFWDIRIYAFPNSGTFYDLGFVLGAALFFGLIGRESEKYYAAGYAQGFAAAQERERDLT